MLKKPLFVCLTVLAALVLSTSMQSQSDEQFTIYLVRHSEKDFNSKNSSDLPLSECGEKRSEALSVYLSDIHLDEIYSTDYTRTRNTAAPTAEEKSIETTIYSAADLKAFAKELLAKKQDALVVGHSNTTGVLAGILTDKNIGDIDLDIYDHIYQVVICGDNHQLNLFHSPFECNN